MLSFLKLIRIPNLLIMAFIAYMVRYCILIPIIELRKSDLDFSLLDVQMTNLDFFLLVLSVVMIGAAGYIINDYFDVRIDEVNRPSTNPIGKTIKRRVAMGAHMTINIIGASIGLWLSYKYHIFRLGSFIFITAPALLWFYSTNLKRQFLVGNLVIALLSAIVPLLVVLFEVPNIYNAFPDLVKQGFLQLNDVMHFTLIVAVFAFFVTLIREIIKDAEDYEGDLEYGCKTMPVVIGISRTKIILAVLGIALMSGLGYFEYLQAVAKEWQSFFYFLVLLQLPIFYLIFRVIKAKGKKDWRFSSLLVKIIMVAGISYLFVFAHGIQLLIDSNGV
ncbi:MAG TPA: geranylgeranylglycerol-phosphate geranylgeranyltransferase [Bacteroidia bacterium]|jgi:4-hydroxybenzoate polyprenyltransferase|nr:geranylgeranylglycerol-phosphate geranylgeranyltransferase [Bacteroidia bacterium]